MTGTFAKTPRTTAMRDRDRITYERASAYAVLDEAYHCHLGFVLDDAVSGAEPRVLPTLHVRIDDTLYLHGSTGSRPLLAARTNAGLPVCVTVTHLDGLVLARSQFHHSANYRSAIAHGRAHLVTDEKLKRRVLTALVDKMGAGRAADTRPPTAKELAETAVLALPLTEVSVKARMGGVVEDAEDEALPHWAGVLPLRLAPGLPEPEPTVTAPVPHYLRPDSDPWLAAPTMRGKHVLLAPLDLSHVEGLFRATDDDEVYRYLLRPRPASPAELVGQVREALRQSALGQRVPFVQLSTATGEVVGATSFYAPDPVNRRISIGYTFLGRPWWRTGVNTEAKLLLMTRAFEELAAVRVEWETDLDNTRSQQAIQRLGARREGVLRRHRMRPDGAWRDTVLYAMTDGEWPAAKQRLLDALADHDSE
jgi:uncharacterized protein